MALFIQRNPEGEVISIGELPRNYTYQRSSEIGIPDGSRTGAFHLSDPDILLSEGFRTLTDIKPYYDKSIELLEAEEPKISNDGLSEIRIWTIRKKTAGEIAIENSNAWAAIQAERNRILAATDWTQGADAANRCNQAAWAKYRQAVFEVTKIYSTPADVVWPDKPE